MIKLELTPEQHKELMQVVNHVICNGYYTNTPIYSVANRVSKMLTPKRYNHAFDIAFSLESTDEHGNESAEDLIAALEAKLNQFKANPQEIIECAGAPFDTYEIE